MLEGPASEETQTFYQCQRRGCSRIFLDNSGYSDFADGQFDRSRASSRACRICGGTLCLVEVNRARKVETWDCAAMDCDYTENVLSPSSR